MSKNLIEFFVKLHLVDVYHLSKSMRCNFTLILEHQKRLSRKAYFTI